jgi:light-regulated signal transduction histidine kinase (bacteriophytochrome)
MSDNKKEEPRRALLTSDFPEADDQPLKMILHDARNAACAIFGHFHDIETHPHFDEFGFDRASVSEFRDRLYYLLKPCKASEMGTAERVEEMVKLRDNFTSILPVRTNIDTSDEDMNECIDCFFRSVNMFDVLLQNAEAYLSSMQHEESQINTDMASVMLPLVASFQKRFPNITFRIDFESNTKVSIYPNTLSRAFENLLLNSVQAMPNDEGEIRIRITQETIREENDRFPGVRNGSYCLIEIIDNGTGISPGLITSILEKKITTKKTGSGLGLASVCHSVRTHRGHLMIESEEGQYTRVTALIPSTIPPASRTVVKQGVVVEEDEIPEVG